MSVYEIDPLCDPRWPEFLQKNPRASVFHTAGWLEALKRTYGYEPVAYTTSAPEAELASAWVFCRICSWLTGRRLAVTPTAARPDDIMLALGAHDKRLASEGYALRIGRQILRDNALKLFPQLQDRLGKN